MSSTTARYHVENYLADLCKEELIVPVVSRVYPLSDYKAALEYVATGEHIGKVVLSHTAIEFQDKEVDLVRRMNEQRLRAKAHRRSSVFSLVYLSFCSGCP